jgi:hypothetical protein
VPMRQSPISQVPSPRTLFWPRWNVSPSPITNRMEAAWVGLLEPGGAKATISIGLRTPRPRRRRPDAALVRKPFAFSPTVRIFLMETRRIGENPDHALANLRSQPPTHYRQLWKTLTPVEQQALRDAAREVPVRGVSQEFSKRRRFVAHSTL